ncbi:MAG: uroporphyrinogen decarboxylase family protein [Limnochordia bacterium]|jgi:hypothetical protein
MVMTSRERILRAFRCEETDRVPIRLWGVDTFASSVADPSYWPLHRMAAQHCDQMITWPVPAGFALTGMEITDRHRFIRPSEHEGFVEVVTVIPTPEGELTSVFLKSLSRKPGYIKEHFIKTPQDIKKVLSIPYNPPRPDTRGFFALDCKVGEKAVPMVGLPSDPVYIANDMIGSELFAIWSIEERPLLLEFISILADRWHDLVIYLLEQGVGPLFGYVGPELCIPPLQSVKDFEEMVVEVDKPTIAAIHDHGGLVWVHCHGGMNPVLELFMEMGVDCLNPIEPPPMGDILLSEAKERVKGRMCLEGNIEVGDFQMLGHEEFRQVCIDSIQMGKPGGGFIFCPSSDHTHWPVLDEHILENYKIFIEVGLEYGRY